MFAFSLSLTVNNRKFATLKSEVNEKVKLQTAEIELSTAVSCSNCPNSQPEDITETGPDWNGKVTNPPAGTKNILMLFVLTEVPQSIVASGF
jgi:hypothetical protein